MLINIVILFYKIYKIRMFAEEPILSRLFIPRGMGRVVITDEAYFIADRVFLVQYFQKTDVIRAFIGSLTRGHHLTDKQSTGYKQRQHTQLRIFIVPVYCAVFSYPEREAYH